MSHLTRLSFTVLLVLFSASVATAQVATGTPPYASYAGGPDTLNLGNLNDHWDFPIVHKPGRGTDFFYDLVYDSSIWTPVTSGSTKSWQPAQSFGWSSYSNVGGGLTGYVTYNFTETYCYSGGYPDGETLTYSNYVYYDPFGVKHPSTGYLYAQEGGCGSTVINDFPAPTTDNSGYVLTGATGGIKTATGGYVNAPFVYSPPTQPYASSFTDRNGNEINASTGGVFTDTLGKTVLTISGSSPTTFTYTTSTGSSAYYTVHYVTKNVLTSFGCSGISEYSQNSVSLVNDVTLPDGSAYTFSYESTPGHTGYVTGRVSEVTLPTGGYVKYTYSGGSSGNITCADGSAATLSRQTPDGTWTYAKTLVSGSQWQTIVTDPSTAANQTSIQFQGIYETQRKIYQGSTSGTLIQTSNTCYNGASVPCTTTAVSLPITQRTFNATIPGSGNLQSQHIEKYDSYGDITESDDYDFATGATFPLLRQTLTSYATIGGLATAFPSSVVIKDGNGNIKSRQDTGYDSYGSGMTCHTGVAQHDDTDYPCTFTARGNATSTTTYTDPVTPGGATTYNYTYDMLGNQLTAQLSCCQLKTWAYSATTIYAYPDSVTSGSSAPQLTTSMTYDLNMGLLLTSTDPNNVKTTLTYDSMGRTLTSQTGSLPSVTYSYTDSGSWSSEVCAPVQGTSTACQNTILDGMGRTKTVQILDGTGALYSATDTQYDVFGRAYKTSNPYTNSPSYWTQLAFDVLGRATSTTLPDNSVSLNSYTDNTVTYKDPAGNQREVIFDGTGRLTSVYEPDPTNHNSLTLQTSYTYNVLDQLANVTQGAQTRTFIYDALGRLNSSTTPEAGAVCFGTYSGGTCQANGYDSWNNLLYRTDARGVVTNYIYDSLNRLVGIAYPTVPSGVSAMPNVCPATGSTNNANVCYVYGTNASNYNNGRITSMTDPSGSESYVYDQYGHVTQQAKNIGGTVYNLSYSYNYANEPTQITYPSGRIVAQSYDSLGRICALGASGSSCSSGTTYATGFLYNSAMQATGFKYGNSLYASFGYAPDMLLPNCLDHSTTNRNGNCTHDATTKFGLQFSHPASPNNNGLISGITDEVDNGRSATYTYDSLYRLINTVTTGSTNFPAWGLSETYDRYGNRTAQATSAGCTGVMCPTNSVGVSVVTNHITSSGYGYDLAGNMTNDGINNLVYDGENRVTSATNTSSSGAYTYDGLGLRIKKVAGSTPTVYVFSGSRVVAEYDNGAAPTLPSREYVYAGGILIAKIDSSGTKYYHHDLLSNRLVTDSNGNTLEQLGQFPFGESWYNGSNDNLLFTSYERDSESGNDYAMARHYISRLSRFASPDPAGLASVTPSNPQSWNRYSYVLDNPINLSDPSGEDWCELPGPPPPLSARDYRSDINHIGHMPPQDDEVSPADFCTLFGGTYHIGNCNTPDGCPGGPDPGNPPPPPPPGPDPCAIFVCGGQTTIGPQQGGGNDSGSTTAKSCVQPRTLQKIGIAFQSAVASFTGSTIGVGAGGTVAGGNQLGVTYAISQQVVVSPNGQAAFVTTTTPISPIAVNSYVSPGISGYGGFQVSLSTARTPQDLDGPALDFGYGGGRGWGGGADLSVGWSGSGPVLQGTLTFPGGFGVPLTTGHGLAPTVTSVKPICP